MAFIYLGKKVYSLFGASIRIKNVNIPPAIPPLIPATPGISPAAKPAIIFTTSSAIFTAP